MGSFDHENIQSIQAEVETGRDRMGGTSFCDILIHDQGDVEQVTGEYGEEVEYEVFEWVKSSELSDTEDN